MISVFHGERVASHTEVGQATDSCKRAGQARPEEVQSSTGCTAIASDMQRLPIHTPGRGQPRKNQVFCQALNVWKIPSNGKGIAELFAVRGTVN